MPREWQALGGTGGFLCLNQGPGGSICLQIHSPCPRGGPGVRYRQMALWHSFPTPFSSWESECSVFERQATLVFSWVLSRRWGIKVAEEPVSCPGLCPRPVPEQKCWRLWDPPKARAQLFCAWTPLSQIGICEQLKYFNQLRRCYIHLSCQEPTNPLGISHQLAEWCWYRTGRWRNSHRRWDAHLCMMCCCVISQPGREDQQRGLMATSGITSSSIQIKK